MSTALLSMYDFVEYRNSNSASTNTSVTVASSTGDKQKSDRMTGLYHHVHQPAVVSAVTSPHKMSSGIRRTVSSAAPSSGMGSVNGVAGNRPVAPGPNCVVKSLSSNTQVSAVRAPVTTHHISSSKDPHKKLDRSFSEPAEKKNASASATSAAQSLGPSSRYKTELCRSFAEVGSCKYGDKCQFAHGEEEMRTVTRHPKFKTENCKSFHSTGFCPYGPRCHFIHNNDEKKANMNANSNGPTTPTIGQRMFADSSMSAPVPVTGNHMNAISQPMSMQAQPAPFPTSTSSAVINNGGNLVRPKALSLGSYSLGSSGEISPPSSQSGSPTSLNSFFTEDGFSLGTPFGPNANSRMATVNAFQTPGNNTFSFSPDSAFVSFNSGASSNGSNSGSSLSFGGNSTKCIFGGSQPTLSSRYSPEPTSADETANSVIFSLFGAPGSPADCSGSMFSQPTSAERMHLNEFIQRAMSPIGKPQMMMYPSSPESPVDSVASEIEALKLGEAPPSFSPISSSFSTSSLSTSSASSPPNGMADLDAFTLLSSAKSGGGVTNIPRLPTFTKFAANGVNCTLLTSAHE